MTVTYRKRHKFRRSDCEHSKECDNKRGRKHNSKCGRKCDSKCVRKCDSKCGRKCDCECGRNCDCDRRCNNSKPEKCKCNLESIKNAIAHLQQHSDAMIKKGICIDDTTAAYTPRSNYPIIPTDTFPSVWPNSAYPISSIRVFSYSLGSAPAKEWVLWAVQNNIKVLIGINLQDYTTDLNALSNDYLAADPTLKQNFNDNVLAYAVGNEANVPEIQQIIDGIAYAKDLISESKLPNKPVSTVLNLNEQWILNTFPPENAIFTADFLNLEQYIDVIMFNTYGGYFIYEPSLLDASLSWTSNGQTFSILLNQFGAVRSAMRKQNITKEFWIGETGWSSAPLGNHPEPPGWSSLPHLKTFYKNFFDFNMDTPYLPQLATQTVMPPNRIFYFSVRDSFLHLLNVEEFFGLFTKQESPLVQKV